MKAADARQTNPSWPAWTGLWSLLWQAVLLTPLAIILTTTWFSVWTAIFVLPFSEVIFVWDKSWRLAAITPVAWILLFMLARSRWFKVSREDLPNDSENI